MRFKNKIMKIRNTLSFIKMLPFAAMLLVILPGCEKDSDPSVRPSVSSTDPASGAIGVAVNADISALFSVTMKGGTASKISVKQGSTAVAGTSSYTGKTVSFNPTEDLLPNTMYTVTIEKSAVNESGASLLTDHSWNFTTGGLPDLILPTVTALSPLDDATGIARNKVLTINFSEAMKATTINNTTFTLTEGGSSVAGVVDYSGTTATFTASSVLKGGTVYTAKLSTGAQDMAGNAIAINKEWNFTTSATASGLSSVDLGVAGDYVILAKTAINNSATSAVTGDLGISPAATTYITGLALTDFTGYATSSQVTGKVYAADMAVPTPVNLTTAVENMITAYNDAAGRVSPDFLELATGNIGGLTLTPGLYKWTTTVTIPSDVIISGGANDIWIFQISGDISMSSAVNITLSGGAQAKNIFWQVAGQATLGATSHFEGVILSMTGITFQTGASINGRALAQTAVVLDNNAVTKPN
jgi:hypothetical protein